MPVSSKCFRIACVLLLFSFLGGCAMGQNPRDPFETFNRGVYDFNEGVDRLVLKPVAEGYRAVLPQFLRTGVSNFFSNINDVLVALNNLLQGKFHEALNDFSRIVINTSIGLLGILDVATAAGIEKNDEDFGQTLGWWGIGDGPFVMIPFLGPSTGRDVVGRVGDFFTDPVTYVDPTRASNQLRAARIVNRRAELLDASTILQTAALDPYEFVRDAYLQRRRSLIYDGAPPPDKEFLDPQPAPEPKPKPKAENERAPAVVAMAAVAPSIPTAAPTASVAAAEPAPRTKRVFVYSADVPTEGSVLVSGESHTPVSSTFGEEAARAPASSSPESPEQPSRLSRLLRVLQQPYQ